MKLLPRVLILLIGAALTSCAVPVSIDSHARQLALQLVDEGIIHLRSGDLAGAGSSFEVSLEIQPTPEAIDGLGCTALLAGKYEEAEVLFIKALQFDEGYSHALGNLALLYDLMGRKELALNIYERALKESPQDFRVRNNFAGVLNDKEAGKNNQKVVTGELRKASVLATHPVIMSNMRKVSYGKVQTKNR